MPSFKRLPSEVRAEEHDRHTHRSSQKFVLSHCRFIAVLPGTLALLNDVKVNVPVTRMGTAHVSIRYWCLWLLDQYIYAESAVKLRRVLFPAATAHGTPHCAHPLVRLTLRCLPETGPPVHFSDHVDLLTRWLPHVDYRATNSRQLDALRCALPLISTSLARPRRTLRRQTRLLGCRRTVSWMRLSSRSSLLTNTTAPFKFV